MSTTSIGGATAVGLALVRAVREESVTFLAAAVAYYAFVSLVPLLVLALAVGSLVGGERLATVAVAAAGGLLAPAGENALASAIVGGRGRGGATVLGLVLLLWSGLKLFRGLDVAFSQVYGSDDAKPLPAQIRDAVVALSAVVVAVTAVVAIGGVLPALLGGVAGEAAAALTLPAVLTAAFLPLYVLFPDVEMHPREALPGAVVAAFAWAFLVGAFRVYAANAGQFELYGVLGAGLLVVTWLYVAAIVLILGAILNAVLAGRTDDGDGTDGDATPDTGTAGPGAETGDATDDEADDGPTPDIAELEREVRELQRRLEEKTVDRSDLEGDLRRYVRARLRRGHARGWGPYLVLLYGTAMTLGAFFYLSGGWAVLSMVVIWLSTLGLYVLMLLVGLGLHATSVPGRALDWARDRRS